MVPIAFGNQTAGSLIRPAAFCGVYGLKPTHGTTIGTGILPLQPYFDTLGYMARAIEDIQSFYGIVSQQNQTVEWEPGRQPKIGLCKTFQWEFAEPEARSVLRQAGEVFRINSAHVEEFELPEDYADLVAVHRRILYAGIAQSLTQDFDSAKEQMSAALRDIIEEGRATSTADYQTALAYADRCRASVNAMFGGYDAIISPK
jgi:amidase